MGTIYIPLDVKGFDLGFATAPELVNIQGTNGPIVGYAFDASGREDLYRALQLPLYGSGNLSVYLQWYSRSGVTTGAVQWGGRIAAFTPGDAVGVEAKNFDTAATTTTTVNAFARGPTETILTISSLDGLASMDTIWLDIYRNAANAADTMTGDAVLRTAMLAYSDV